MWAGTYFAAIENFLKEHDFDILCFQEVCGPQTYVGNIRCEIDCFEKLQDLLQATHNGILTKASTFTSSQNAYDGNAIFYKKGFTLKNQDVIWINKRTIPFPSDAKSFGGVGRNGLSLELEREGKTVYIVTAHLPWGTTKKEESHQTELNKRFSAYIQSLNQSWILTGDLNLAPDQPSIIALEQYGHNLTKEFGVKNTIDPTFHKRWNDFDPGEAIDYIFVSPDVHVENFQVLDKVHMSDHLGLTAEIEI